MDLSSVGRNIKKYRKLKKLTQEQLAQKTSLTSNYIGMVERGEKIPSLETFVLLVNALEVSSDKILSGVIDKGYLVKVSILTQKLSMLNEKEKDHIIEVLDILIRHSAEISR